MGAHTMRNADHAQACWLVEPGRAEIRSEPLRAPGPGEVLVRTLHSAVSRGTEALVFRGEVPPGEAARMRAPFQAGDFPAPVKYGYCNVGLVEAGPAHVGIDELVVELRKPDLDDQIRDLRTFWEAVQT